MTLEDVLEKADPNEYPGVRPLLEAWKERDGTRDRRPLAAVADVIVRAGEIRERQRRADVELQALVGGAPASERVKQVPTAKQHSRMLIYVLLPTVEGVRADLFGQRKAPFRSTAQAQAATLSVEQRRVLDSCTDRIAQASGFQPDDVRQWILTGTQPKLGVLMRLTRRWVRLPDDRWIQASRIQIELSTPVLAESDVRAVARDVRELWREHGTKRWSDDDIRLLRAIRQAGGAPQGRGMVARWTTIASQAKLPSWQAAAKRWPRVREKAKRFGVPIEDELRPRLPSPQALSAMGIGYRTIPKTRP